jgi:hypothetical protein
VGPSRPWSSPFRPSRPRLGGAVEWCGAGVAQEYGRCQRAAAGDRPPLGPFDRPVGLVPTLPESDEHPDLLASVLVGPELCVQVCLFANLLHVAGNDPQPPVPVAKPETPESPFFPSARRRRPAGGGRHILRRGRPGGGVVAASAPAHRPRIKRSSAGRATSSLGIRGSFSIP